MKLLVVLLAIAATAMGSNYDDFKCIPLSSFMLDCNECSCSVDGSSSLCTLKACYPNQGLITYLRLSDKPIPANTQVCKPHSTFKIRCNECKCGADGTTYQCTEQACGEEVRDIYGAVTVLPATSAVTTPRNNDGGLKCIPLASFMLDCNECSCAVDGGSALCTLKACHPSPGLITYRRFSDKPIPANTQVCKPHSIFKIRCNECRCGEDGTTYQCTELACGKEVWNADGSLTVLPAPTGVTNPEQQVCQPLSTFKYYCNTCGCSVDGTSFVCTRMECDINVWNPDGSLKIIPYSNRVTRSVSKQVCQPRTTFKDYCNSCTCSVDGTTYACTRMACDKEIWNPDGSLKIAPRSNRVTRSVSKQVCQPRTTFKNYCNSCTCSVDGTTYACTRMACDKEIWNPDGSLKIAPRSNRVARSVSKQVCEPLSQFKDYCNTCGCATDGMSFACTRMMCDKEIWNPDGSLKILPKLHSRVGRSASKQVCEPLTQFKNYCNTCGCSADGTSYACTRMMCDKSIWNKDGSLKPHAQSLLSQSEKSCKPGTTFSPDQCNTCYCNEDGTSECTLKLCLTHDTEPIWDFNYPI